MENEKFLIAYKYYYIQIYQEVSNLWRCKYEMIIKADCEHATYYT